MKVSSVFPGSPAEMADVRIGDELLYINGNEATELPCGAQTWESPTAQGMTQLTLMRSGRQRQEMIPLTPLRNLLASFWQVDSDSLRAVSFRDSEHAEGYPKIYGPFTTGLFGEKRGSHFVVTAVLHGSAAQRGGARVGDKIVVVNGTPVSEATGGTLSQLWTSDYRQAFHVKIEGQPRPS
jgi:predicted metalloprotease with PDZ domain